MREQPAVKQVAVALQEPLEGVLAPPLKMDGNQMDPRSGDRLVVLVFGAVKPGDMLERARHRIDRILGRVLVQVARRQLKMLAMTEATPGVEDLVEDLEVTFSHTLTISMNRLTAFATVVTLSAKGLMSAGASGRVAIL